MRDYTGWLLEMQANSLFLPSLLEGKLLKSCLKREKKTCWWECKWCSCCGKHFGGPSETYIELPYDPAILLLGRNPNELITDTCTPVLLAALFTVAKTRMSTNEQNVAYLYNRVLFSHKKE